MQPSIKIMLPTFPDDKEYFKGYVSLSGKNEIMIYITDYMTSDELLRDLNYSRDVIYGYCIDFHSKMNKLHSRNFLILVQSQKPRINKLVIDGNRVDGIDNCIIMFYDSNRINSSEVISGSTDCLLKLRDLMHTQNSQPQSSTSHEPVLSMPYWLSSSMFAQHLLNYFNLIHWLISTIRRDKKVSIRQGNLILAFLTDIFLGYLVLRVLTEDQTNLSAMLMGALEKLVNLLYSLLKWLMGAPAGLKLNNAFNKMLGKYFSYHIQLWWLFLDVSREKLDTILEMYHYLGYLGLTFQAAIISDMISIATFHSYCIYVYAARLFNIQVSGLIALLRLFVGRKYNPLRGGIDSCEYTNQELFVGTVAFTILLLLLPTTTMYYIVFTLFRLMSLVVQYTLAKLIHAVQTAPLYVLGLWLARSPKVAGNILLEVMNSEEAAPLILKVKLFSKSLGELVSEFKPPVEAPKQFEWTNVLSNVFIGKQII